MVLTAGRHESGNGQEKRRCEGVAIVPTGPGVSEGMEGRKQQVESMWL